MSVYVNLDHVLEYLDSVRANRNINTNPYMDNVLLNVRQMLALTIPYDPLLADSVDIGGCESCIYSNRRRPQKCSCCRRNRYLKDCYEEV